MLCALVDCNQPAMTMQLECSIPLGGFWHNKFSNAGDTHGLPIVLLNEYIHVPLM